MPQKLTQEEFIKKCTEKHGNTYDYSKAVYKNILTKVCIICHEKDENGKEHGEFWQNPQAHYLRGDGCPICRYIKSKKSLRESVGLTTEKFIERAQIKHNNKYDYSNAIYENTETKVKIICPEHGEFLQTPHHHLNGHGCPICGRKELSEKRITNIIKEHFNNVITQYKPEFLIGYQGKYQTLDIFLPDYNIAIEYQGRHHFSPQKHFGEEKGFNLTKERDIRKYNKCKENGIKIFYFTYENKKEIPETYIDKIFVSEDELINEIKSYSNDRF